MTGYLFQHQNAQPIIPTKKKTLLCDPLQLFLLYRKVDKVHTDTISYKGADSHLPTDSCKKEFCLFLEAEMPS